MGEGEDEPGVFGDDVGGDEIDFGEFVRDGASVDAAMGVEVVEAVLHLRGGFYLDADQARAAGVGGEALAVVISVIVISAVVIAAAAISVIMLSAIVIVAVVIAAIVILTIVILTVVILTIEDDVVAVAVAEGFGDTEAVAGGGQGEGEFGDLAAAFGGEFAVEWSLLAGRGCGRSLGETQFASAESGLAFAHEFWVRGLNFGPEKWPEKTKGAGPRGCANL